MNHLSGEPEAKRKIRAFIALKCHPEWDEHLAQLQTKLKHSFRSSTMRWVTPDQIHITLRFLGSIVHSDAEKIATLLPSTCSSHQPFTLQCSDLGCFPNTYRPRILWAGLAGDLPQASMLQAAVTCATKNFGEPPEDRPFKPHLTLARIHNLERSNLASLEKAIADGATIEHLWNVRDVLLVRSHLSSEGARYETLGSYPLGN